MDFQMAANTVREEVRRGFGTNDHVSATDLKRVSLRVLMREGRKVIVLGHNRPEAVMIAPEMWEALRDWDAYTQALEDVVSDLEDEELARRYAERAAHVRHPAPDVVDEALALLRQRMPE